MLVLYVLVVVVVVVVVMQMVGTFEVSVGPRNSQKQQHNCARQGHGWSTVLEAATCVVCQLVEGPS